jgi:hypothetical protein
VRQIHLRRIVGPAPHAARQDFEAAIAGRRKGADVDRDQLGLALQGQIPAHAALDPPVARRKEAQSDDRPLEALLVGNLDYPEADIAGLGRRRCARKYRRRDQEQDHEVNHRAHRTFSANTSVDSR